MCLTKCLVKTFLRIPRNEVLLPIYSIVGKISVVHLLKCNSGCVCMLALGLLSHRGSARMMSTACRALTVAYLRTQVASCSDLTAVVLVKI